MSNKLDHVLYEIDMYLNAPSPAKGKRSIYENNAFWECRMIHLRNLIDFFGGHYINDDMRLKDIITGMKPDNSLHQGRHPALIALNKSICHLSESRYCKSRQKEAQIQEYFNENGDVKHDAVDGFYRGKIMLKINEFLDLVLSDTRYSENHKKAKYLKDTIQQGTYLFIPCGVSTTTNTGTSAVAYIDASINAGIKD